LCDIYEYRLTELILKDNEKPLRRFVKSIDRRLLREIKKDAVRMLSFNPKRKGGVSEIHSLDSSIFRWFSAV